MDWKAKVGKLKKVSNEYGQAQKGVLSQSDYIVVGTKEDYCESVIKAIIVQGSNLGKVINICKDPKCKVHKGTQSQYGLTPKEREERKEDRKKEIEKNKKAKVEMEKKLADALKKVKWPLSEKNLEALIVLSLEFAGSNTNRTVAKRHELEIEKESNEWGGTCYRYDKAILKMAKGSNKSEKIKLVFELLVDTGYGSLLNGVEKI